MSSSLAEMGVLLNPTLETEPDQNIRANFFKDWLEKNDKWLVIYDNVDEPEKLSPFVPANKKGHCFFTSNFPLTGNLAVNVPIEKLTEAESKRLLFSRTHNTPHKNPTFSDEKERQAFEKIITEIDGHPLALNTTGAFIGKNFLNFQKFAVRLENEPSILLENEDGFDKYQHKSVLKAFSIAFEDVAIPKKEDKFKNSPTLAKNILGAVSFIAPEDFPEELLREIFEFLLKPQTLFQRILAFLFRKKLSNQEKENLWQEVRLKLLNYDLLKFDKSLTNLTTHRLVQKVVEFKLSQNESNELLQIALKAIDSLFPFSEFGNWETCQKYETHSISLLQKSQQIERQTESIAILYEKTGRYLRDSVKYNEAINYFEKAITLYEQLFGRENANVAASLNNLAYVYQLQGRYDEAIKFRLICIDINRKVFGNEHTRIATDLNNLANVYHSQGKYDEAIEKFEETLKIDEKTIGKEHSAYATGLNNLAGVYKSQGKYDEAIEKYKEALLIGEKTIGKEHPDYATHLNNLASVYDSQGKYNDAIEKYEEALRIDEKTIGKEHPEYAIHLNNLANIYLIQGKIREALNLYLETERIWKNTLPENHLYIAMVKESIRICGAKLSEK